MQINIAGHHVDITDALRQAIEDKYHKIGSHYPQLEALDVTLTVERNEQTVEAVAQYLGVPIAVNARDFDMYVAIADSAKKFDAALSHRKGHVVHQRPAQPPIEPEV